MPTNYCVVGQGVATSGSATISGSPKRLVPGVNNLTVTTTVANQTFTVTMCAGTSASVASGTATVSGSPNACAQGAVTTITITNVITNGTLTITVTYNTPGLCSSGYTWASSSGGTPNTGTALSNSSTTVDLVFDANSFTAAGQEIDADISGGTACNNFTWTLATNNPTLSGTHDMAIYGNAVLIAAMTYTGSTGLDFYGASSTLTTNGCAMSSTGGSELGTYAGSLTLQDTLNCNGTTLVCEVGTLNTNGQTVNNCGLFTDGGVAGAKSVILGASVINTATWSFAAGGLSLTANTSTINITGASQFDGGSQTYNIVNFQATGTYTITGSNTFAQFNLASGATQTITFTDTTTQTAASLSLSGSAGNVHTLQGSSTGGWNITYTGAGQLLMDYISVSYSTANPDNTFYDYTHGTDGGNNTHWYFNAPTGLGLSAIPLGFIHGR